MKSICLEGKIIDLSKPIVMGILNCTPNSFYDGGKFTDEKSIVNQVEKMLEEEASIIDVGGASSKPNIEETPLELEISRISFAIKVIKKYFPASYISIDTYRSEVAQIALSQGACMINDISAGELDSKMLPLVAQSKVPYIGMHMKGNPQNMQKNTHYEDILIEMYHYFSHKISYAHDLGINDYILDVGFGFAKKSEQNFHILKNLAYFKNLNKILLVGISRKSMIYNTLGISANESLNGTTALNMVALQNGANILRVHDVKEAVETVKLFNELNKSK